MADHVFTVMIHYRATLDDMELREELENHLNILTSNVEELGSTEYISYRIHSQIDVED